MSSSNPSTTPSSEKPKRAKILQPPPPATEVIRLTPREIEDLRAAFKLYDFNNDGKVHINLLRDLIQSQGPLILDHELGELIKEVDPENNRYFMVNAFLQVMIRKFEEMSAAETIREAFKAFDREGFGMIKSRELSSFCLEIGATEEEVKELLKDADRQNMGEIDTYRFLLKMDKIR